MSTLAKPSDGVLAVVREVGDLGLRTGAVDRLALAHDASHYLLTPEVIIEAADVDHLVEVVRSCSHHDVPLTFRSGGTSLSGQAVTRSVLVDTRRHFRRVEVLDDGLRVRAQPGATVREVNARLAPYRRKLGPDPASEAACTIGGVVANNSSGMSCGTAFNTYATVDALTFVLPSGTVIDSSQRDADEQLRAQEPSIHAGLLGLRDRLRDDPAAVRTVRRLFELKNTMGYGVNAFLDFDRPIDLLTHLIVGSEGTLAFVAEAVFRTVPKRPSVMTGLLLFDDVQRATEALLPLRPANASAIELLDARSLAVSKAGARPGSALDQLSVVDHAALLVEFESETADELGRLRGEVQPLLQSLNTSAPWRLTSQAAERAELWRLRKGLYAAVAGARPVGTTAILEDVAVPVAHLATTCQELDRLLRARGYDDSVVFGHAKDGNIHFLVNERLDNPGRLTQYQLFTEELVDLILGAGGTLKAEHGTGRAMAPFLARQYGPDIHSIMMELKHLLDPGRIMNPDVIISDDDTVHLRDLKSTPQVEEEVDRCVECGYCEPVCPSKDLTLTPRQRIVLRREQQRAQLSGDSALAAELEGESTYPMLETCAADGMCQTACPVSIDTGALVKRLREQTHGATLEWAWSMSARRWDKATRGASRALTAAAHLPRAADWVLRALRVVSSKDVVPAWSADLPAGGSGREGRVVSEPDVIFLPSCLQTVFASSGESQGVAAAFLELCQRAGVRVSIPEGIEGLCCGTPWKSKGMRQGLEVMRGKVVAALERSVANDLPVVVDAASCTEGFADLLRDASTHVGDSVEVVDVTQFVADRILGRLRATSSDQIALHPTCSSTRMGLNDVAIRIVEAMGGNVSVPLAWSCCGFAGDRGLLHPELTASATRGQVDELRTQTFDAYLSLNRTCELAMTRATGQQYRHILEWLADITRPAEPKSQG